MSGLSKFTAIISVVLFLVLFIFLLLSFYFEYKPEPVEYALKIRDGGEELGDDKIKIMSWNIGYASLGKDAEFFMDGGNGSKPDSLEIVKENLSGIRDIIKKINADIIFLQEVDVQASRTFDVMQVAEIVKDTKNYNGWFATNFRTFFVPVPWYEPMGNVWSGIMTLSKFIVKNNVERHSLPESKKWPDKMFDMKRCMLVSRIALDDKGRELVIVNLHLSAFNEGELKRQQLEFVVKYLIREYERGNAVIAGGDWNHSMPGIKKDCFGTYTTSEENLKWLGTIDEKFVPEEWKWAFDPDNPSVRSNEKPYKKGENFISVIDGFLLSPDIVLEKVYSMQSDFKYSDHEAVVIEITVKDR